MPTKPRDEFTLSPIVRLASEDAGTKTERHRYWLRSSGELTREKPLLPWPKSTFFVIVAGEPEEPVAMSFEAALPVPGTTWTVPITGVATFVCPPQEVHRLVTRWMRTREMGDPDVTFRRDFSDALTKAVASCGERAIADADGMADGGRLGEEVSKLLARTWGLRCALCFEFTGKSARKRRDVLVEASVRLHDYEADIPVTAVVELLVEASSPLPLRARAALEHQDDLSELFAEDLRFFYSTEVGIDQLSDPLKRDAYQRRLAERIRTSAAGFGLQARFLKPVEMPPSIPGDTDEVVRVSLPGVQLRGEAPVDIALLIKLRLTSTATLVRAMVSQPGVSFNAEFERIARSILGSMAAGWSAEDLLRERRAPIEGELRESLEEWARRYGYEAVDCTLTTTVDVTPPETDTVTLWEGRVLSAETSVSVDVTAIAELKYRPGVRAGQAPWTLLEPITGSASKIIGEIIGAYKPSEIYRYWSVPFRNGAPALQHEIRKRLVRLLSAYADEPMVTLRLHGQVEFVQLYETIQRSTIECKGVRLKPDKVPGELTVDLHAPVVALTEQAWAEMITRRMIADENWNPLAVVSQEIPRLLQSAFAAVLESHKGTRLSKRETTELLNQHVTREIRERFAVEVRPEISFHSSPEIVESYRRLAEEKQSTIRRYFDLRDMILAAIEEKEREKITLIGEGNAGTIFMEDTNEALLRLKAQHRSYERKTKVLQQEYSDASYYIQLLSTPDDLDEGAKLESIQMADAHVSRGEARQYLDETRPNTEPTEDDRPEAALE